MSGQINRLCCKVRGWNGNKRGSSLLLSHSHTPPQGREKHCHRQVHHKFCLSWGGPAGSWGWLSPEMYSAVPDYNHWTALGILRQLSCHKQQQKYLRFVYQNTKTEPCIPLLIPLGTLFKQLITDLHVWKILLHNFSHDAVRMVTSAALCIMGHTHVVAHLMCDGCSQAQWTHAMILSKKHQTLSFFCLYHIEVSVAVLEHKFHLLVYAGPAWDYYLINTSRSFSAHCKFVCQPYSVTQKINTTE